MEMGVLAVLDAEPAIVGEMPRLRSATPTAAPAPSPSPEPISEPLPPDAPEPPPVLPLPTVEPVALTDAEAVICSVWTDLCAKALRVAACESGPDYYAGWSAHVGTFQIYPGHAYRFREHGWDYYVDGDDIYANSVIAYEIFLDSGWQPWPYCGLR